MSLAGTVIYKMTGSGNDFVFVDGRATPLARWTPELIRDVCARQRGVGADGLVVLEPGGAPSAVRLHYFNSDGRRAELCGNASLCAVRLAQRIELTHSGEVTLETDAGPLQARALGGPGERAEIVVGDLPSVSRPAVPLHPGEAWAKFIRVGVPHLVVRVEALDRVPVAARGRELRNLEVLKPAGANVNFVSESGGAWSVRTFERGVEAETLACGTGAVAVAAVLADQKLVELPVGLTTASGCVLTVSGRRTAAGGFADVSLAGEGRLVFRAILGG